MYFITYLGEGLGKHNRYDLQIAFIRQFFEYFISTEVLWGQNDKK